MTRTVALICPNDPDRQHLAECRERWESKYRVFFHGPNAENAPADFDALAYVSSAVEELRAAGVDGVTSASDYPGCLVAAALVQELGLPGPSPQAVFRCSHKYYARLAQRESVPDACPSFWLVDPQTVGDLAGRLPYPVFVKPIKSWFSQHARRVDTPEELIEFATDPGTTAFLSSFVAPFDQLLGRYTDLTIKGGYLIAEELLGGRQVTLEGFVYRSAVTILGITDSIMYPGTISFQRFDFPSSLPLAIQRRMHDVAARVMMHVGFDNSLFNIEMFYDEATDTVKIIEINPRICGQFADLYEKVTGTNTYEILLALAAGEQPDLDGVQRATCNVQREEAGGFRSDFGMGTGRGRYRVAASFVLRSFQNMRVTRVPDDAQIAAVKRRYPETQVTVFYRAGQLLSDEDQADEASYRYALMHMGADDHSSLLAAYEDAKRMLGFQLEEVGDEHPRTLRHHLLGAAADRTEAHVVPGHSTTQGAKTYAPR